MKKLTSQGFAALEALLIVVIVAILGGTGYYVYHANQKTSDTLNSASKDAQSSPQKKSSKVDPIANWTAFTSTKGQFSLKYPSSWVQPSHRELCVAGFFDRALFLGPDSDSVLKCGSDDLGQIMVNSSPDPAANPQPMIATDNGY